MAFTGQDRRIRALPGEAVAAALPLLERLAREPAHEQPPQDLPGLRDVPVESARTFAAWRPRLLRELCGAVGEAATAARYCQT